MAEITAADVKRLRDATGAGMMACKQALVDAEGDFDRAADLVRERTGARMDARVADRTASEGLVHAYLHAPMRDLPPKLGVLVQLNCETDFVAKNERFQELAREIAMHIAAARPMVISEGELDERLIEKEREFARKEAADQGKPDHVIDRIVEGRVRKLYEEQVLLNQPWVRDPEKTIGELVSEVQGVIGEKIEVSRFALFEVV